MTVSQVNLHQHSEASHLDGIAKFAEIALGSRQLGQEAAVITDHGEVAGHFAFQKACHAEGIHPVLGMEGYWHHDIAAARATGRYPTDLSHIVLLAKDNKGLENLWALSSIAYTPEHFYHRPLADPALLRKYSEGLYASDACMMTQLGKAVERSDEDGVRSYAATLLDVYRDNFYMELHTWQFMNPVAAEGHPDGPGCWGKASPGKISCQVCLNSLMTQINQAKVSTANQLGVPLVVVNDSHHVWAQQWENKDFLCRIKKDKGDQIAEGKKADHLMGDEELYHWMSLHGIGRSVVSEAISNAHRIAMSCTAEVSPTLEVPVYSQGDGDDNAAFLDLIEKGFRRRVIDAGRDVEKYWARVEPEVEMIVNRGLSGYFLIVEDYVRAARTGTWKQALNPAADPEPMIIGPARGSAGGSLVSYLLGITTIDPIKYGLLFERFLNPARKGLPDIDTDFPQSKRPDMKAYLEARWGADHVCTLNTVVRNGPKGMIRDLSKIYDISYNDVNEMSKLVDQALAIVMAEREAEGEATGGDDDEDDDLSWAELMAEKGGDLAPYARKYPAMFEKLGEMVGVARGSGVHPSGILINKDSLLGKTPTRYNAKRKVTTTQFDMWDTEALGGVKFDLLGLRHLDTLDHARTLIEQRHGVSLNFDEFDEELRDPDIWEAIDRGHTVGLFQVESPLATRVATSLKPRSEVDVAALISIIRPGVKDAGLMDEYLQRRSGERPVVYDHPLMKDLTEETYGVLVYQEQLILASQELAGWTLSEGDDLRKALGKKLADVLAEMRDKFLSGCLANSAFMDPIGGDTKVATKIATKIWGSISAAGRYAFNKSHAVGYATLATWEVWVKHYYPEEFIVALMATDGKNINRYVREARRRNIPVLPPDINESGQKFTIGSDGIRYGLDTVDKVGAMAVKDILSKRPYATLQDYLDRVDGRGGGNKAVVTNLIKIGAFDSLEYIEAWDGDWRPACRTRLMRAYHDHRVWMKVAVNKRNKMDVMQRAEHLAAWFDKHSSDANFVTEFAIPNFESADVIHDIETELVGNFILVDPMAPYLDILSTAVLQDPSELADIEKGKLVDIGGQLVKVKRHKIKTGRNKGAEMAFLGIDYNEALFDVTVFSDLWNQTKNLLTEGSPVVCRCIRDDRGVHLSSMERLDLLFGIAEAG